VAELWPSVGDADAVVPFVVGVASLGLSSGSGLELDAEAGLEVEARCWSGVRTVLKSPSSGVLLDLNAALPFEIERRGRSSADAA
jgi:hypothetical protein